MPTPYQGSQSSTADPRRSCRSPLNLILSHYASAKYFLKLLFAELPCGNAIQPWIIYHPWDSKTKSTVVRLRRLHRQMEGPEPYLIVSFANCDLRHRLPLGMLLHIMVLHLWQWQVGEAGPDHLLRQSKSPVAGRVGGANADLVRAAEEKKLLAARSTSINRDRATDEYNFYSTN
jgi:hypothetical protein